MTNPDSPDDDRTEIEQEFARVFEPATLAITALLAVVFAPVDDGLLWLRRHRGRGGRLKANPEEIHDQQR